MAFHCCCQPVIYVTLMNVFLSSMHTVIFCLLPFFNLYFVYLVQRRHVMLDGSSALKL